MTVTIRSGVPTDAPELSRLATETFIDGWATVVGSDAASGYAAHYLTAERLHTELYDTEAHFFSLATNGETGAITGYGKLDLLRPAHESVTGVSPVLLQRLYVAASVRGLGVADALLVALETEATRRGYGTLWLECDPQNPRAWRFYEKRDFAVRGQVAYALPNGQNDNVFVMERAISVRQTVATRESTGAS